jgi:alpha-1,4-digalacturonate transport system substrate-binding protein
MAISATVRRGRLRWLSVGVIAALTLGACGSGDSDDGADAKSITFWYSTSAQDQGYIDLAKDFQAKTGISVEIVNLPNDGYDEKVKQAAQANALPDTASVPGLDPLWVNQLQDLGSIANNATNNINKDLITAQDGKVLAIPSDVTAAGLYINKTLFDKAKVAYPTDPSKTWTWDEFLAAATKVRTATKAKYDLVYDRSPARIRPWIYTHGGKGLQLGADGKYAADATTVQAIGDFAKLSNDVIMPKSVWGAGADPNALFKSGQVVAYFSGVWQVADFADGITNFEWASAATPAQPVHATDINLGGKVVAFSNKGKAEAAKKWVDFIFQRDNYTKLAQANGYLPIEKGLTLTYPFKKKAALDAFALYVKEMEIADPISASGQANQTKLLLAGKTVNEDVFKDEMAKLVNGQQDAQKTVDNIVAGLNQQIG